MEEEERIGELEDRPMWNYSIQKHRVKTIEEKLRVSETSRILSGSSKQMKPIQHVYNKM